MKQTPEQKREFIEAIEQELTILNACKKTNLARQTVYRWFKEDKQFKKDVESAVKNAVLEINDDCENRIVNKIKNDDTNAIKFWLKYHHESYKQSYILTK